VKEEENSSIHISIRSRTRVTLLECLCADTRIAAGRKNYISAEVEFKLQQKSKTYFSV
jgi:hypothetical protein